MSDRYRLIVGIKGQFKSRCPTASYLRKKSGFPGPSTTIAKLSDDVLLEVFYWCRLVNITYDADKDWNRERWWYKLTQVCHLWRRIVLASPNRLNLHLVCTYGIPVETMLLHSPPFPLIIYYPRKLMEMAAEDKKGVIFALEQRDRVRRVHLELLATCLCDLIKVMDDDYPMLQTLVIRSQTDIRTCNVTVMLPEKLRAPLLNRLGLSNIVFPIKSVLLTSADGIVVLVIENYPAVPYFHPEYLVAKLSAMAHLEVLSIHFHSAITNREVERNLLHARVTHITLPNLRLLAFCGGSAYLEGILARLDAPSLETLNVEFFNQLTFHLPSLLHFSQEMMSHLKLDNTEVHFENDFVTLIIDPRNDHRQGQNPFHVQVRCKSLDWQASCIAQICSTLAPLLVRTESLQLGFHWGGRATSWQADVDPAQWYGLLATFRGVKTLHFAGWFVADLFRLLQLPNGGLPEELLPSLQEVVPSGWGHPNYAFSSFINARLIAGFPIRLVQNR
jgi:hypothetical protein